MTRILFVHGRSQQGKSSEQLRSEWTPALERGLNSIGKSIPSSVEFDFPFYGDTLIQIAEGMDLPLDEEIKSKGGDIDAEYRDFRHTTLEQIRLNAKISDAMIDEGFDNETTDKGPQNWEWVHRVIRAIDKHVPELRDHVLDEYLRDTFVYLSNPAVRKKINQIVEDSISDEDTIVVSHSLGTVVAFDVLVKTPKNISSPIFITLGSPLGIKGIRSRMEPIENPAKSQHWYNAFDERDVVSLNPLNDKYFKVSPPIENNSKVKNHTANRHSIGGYLDDPNVVSNIVKALS